MTRFLRLSLPALVLSLAAPAAMAQTPPPPPPVPSQVPKPTVRPLTAEETQFLASEADMVRQLRLLTLRAKIVEQQRKIEGGAGQPGADSVNVAPALPTPIMRPGSVAPSQAASAPTPAPAAPPPRPFQVVSVWGVEGRLTAEILANGMRIPVQRGTALPRGWKVIEVRRTGVVIGKGRARDTLMVGG